MASAEGSLNRAINAPTSQIYDVGSQVAKLGAGERFDAIRVSFTNFALASCTEFPP